MAKQENIRQYMKIMAMAITASRYTTVKLKEDIYQVNYGNRIATEIKYRMENSHGACVSVIFTNSNDQCTEWHLKTKKIYYNQFGCWGKEFKEFCEPFFINLMDYEQWEVIKKSKKALSNIKNTAGLDNFKKLLEMNNIKEVA